MKTKDQGNLDEDKSNGLDIASLMLGVATSIPHILKFSPLLSQPARVNSLQAYWILRYNCNRDYV